ncbi:hypothetical protein [Georgenia thermotolerans]|uniref:hypothetical protein n=1 Tax=Georgenia thermotolerans TaxID=527326 RepID=UPI00186ADC28|nr:hypothetical protein [Georgenia thermotolerans]
MRPLPRPARAVALALGLAVAVLAPAPADAAGGGPAAGAPAASAPAPTGACADGSGVTVVVDLTDLGGDVRAGCAPGDPATGREALQAAGFAATDSQPGLICAIDHLPDPCPTQFDGRYWAYWSAGPGGQWTARTEGADTADPAPGSVEGWRYNDGATPPGVTPAALAAAASPTAAASEEPAASATPTPAPEGHTASRPGRNAYLALGAAVILLVAAGVVARRRGRG